jgi:histidine ammonia-lyase
VLQLTEQVTASALFAVCQGLQLRVENGDLSWDSIGSSLQGTLEWVRESSPKLTEDRALDKELRTLIARIQNRERALYPEG